MSGKQKKDHHLLLQEVVEPQAFFSLGTLKRLIWHWIGVPKYEYICSYVPCFLQLTFISVFLNITIHMIRLSRGLKLPGGGEGEEVVPHLFTVLLQLSFSLIL